MIAFDRQVSQTPAKDDWQSEFLAMLPHIERQLHYAFRRLDPEAREEAIQEGVANCCQAFQRLHRQGRQDQAYASSLAKYAAAQIRSGRQMACPLNVRDPLSQYAQRRKGFRVERLHERCPAKSREWLNAAAADRRTPVLDQVALRIDMPAWFRTLSHRAQDIAKDLAMGFSTGEVAKKYGLSSGRISQIRRELLDSWNAFHESCPAPAAE